MTYTEWQRGDHVRELQEYLRAASPTDNVHSELAVDGIYGPETTEAVRSFQLANGLPPTGQVDRETWEELLEEYLDALTLLSDAVALQAFQGPQNTLRRGNTGNTVYILQAVLNTLTEAYEEWDDLAVNGVYDEATAQRVTELQRGSGFPENGEVDRAFWDHLATRYNQGG